MTGSRGREFWMLEDSIDLIKAYDDHMFEVHNIHDSLIMQ